MKEALKLFEGQNIMKDYDEVSDAQKRYVMKTYSASLMILRGKGAYLWDNNNRKYLDFTSGISVCNLGHSHPAIAKAIGKQSKKLVHVSNLFLNEKQPLLAKKLVENSIDGQVFFCNSGGEANEGMIKFARKWGNPKGKHIIISMENSFHGRTLATLSATGREKYRKGFEPAVEGFVQVPYNNINAVKDAVEKTENRVAGILLEPIQGEGGIVPANNKYLKELRTFCTDNEILLMFDEVQCGMGRTGKMFGYQNYDVKPDLISLAKALGNGYPIGAFIAARALEGVLTPGTHASTFGGTPLACSAALATLKIYEKEELLKNCLKMGKLSKELLGKLKKKHAIIKEIRGYGLMIGIELKEKASDIVRRAQQNGLLIITAGENVLRFYPPLNITKSELKKGIKLLDRSIIEA